MKIIGLDIGFGFTKVTDGHRRELFKSVIGEATDIQFRAPIGNSGRDEEHLHLTVDDEAFFAGDLAERQSSVRSFTLDQDQLIAGYAKRLALAGLTRLVGDNDPIHVVTGLPVRYFRRHREAISNLLTGSHKLSLHDIAGKAQEITLRVDKVRVVPQPFGSFFGAMLNDIGRVAEARFARDKIGIIDIGFRTADYSIADRTRYSERGSGTSDAGIARAFEPIAAALQERSGVSVELYRLYDAVQSGSIKIRGNSYDLARITERAFGQLAAAIAGEVNRLWADDWDVDAVLLAGGGGAVLAPYLQPLLEHEVLPLPEQDPRFANVNGYWKYGVHLWKR
ncbi:MAG: ParM/StbA family protein [Salinisphaeraceae bacterium]